MRIVGGEASGRPIKAPPGSLTRPTGERVREALFSIVQRRVEGARILDLYGGSGALSLEALSRGATCAVVVEPAASARRVIADNAARLGMTARIRILKRTAERAVADLRGEAFDLVFCDPPWRQGLSRAVASGLSGVVAAGAVVVVEHPAGEEPPECPGLERGRTRRYGGTHLTFYHAPEHEG